MSRAGPLLQFLGEGNHPYFLMRKRRPRETQAGWEMGCRRGAASRKARDCCVNSSFGGCGGRGGRLRVPAATKLCSSWQMPNLHFFLPLLPSLLGAPTCLVLAPRHRATHVFLGHVALPWSCCQAGLCASLHPTCPTQLGTTVFRQRRARGLLCRCESSPHSPMPLAEVQGLAQHGARSSSHQLLAPP